MTAVLTILLPRLALGERLSPMDAGSAFDAIMSGTESPVQIAAFLTALRVRGETVDEITAAAKAMRANSLKVDAPADAIDMCGTGGDAANTFNISTAATFVVAGAGVPIAKHGNRAQSSKSGAADVLAALGVNLDLSPMAASECLRQAGIAFLFAQNHHPAMRHVAPIRSALGFRTIFNLLGPLTSPASVRRQLIGVYAQALVNPIAHVLKELGLKRALVVHGADGLDEITTTGPTHAALLHGGTITDLVITPEDAGIRRATLAHLGGGTATENAIVLRGILSGKMGPLRDIVCLNAAGGFLVAERVDNLVDGVAMAATAIDSGAATLALERLIEVSQTLRGLKP